MGDENRKRVTEKWTLNFLIILNREEDFLQRWDSLCSDFAVILIHSGMSLLIGYILYSYAYDNTFILESNCYKYFGFLKFYSSLCGVILLSWLFKVITQDVPFLNLSDCRTKRTIAYLKIVLVRRYGAST